MVCRPYEEHVVRRNVEWLTATTEASVNFTPIHELEGFVTPNGCAGGIMAVFQKLSR